MNRRTAVPLAYAGLVAGAYLVGGWGGVVVFVGSVLALGSILSLVVTLLQRTARPLPFHRRFVSNFGKVLKALLFTLP